MAEEKRAEKQEKKLEGKSSKFLDLIAKLIGVIESVPKAVAAVLLAISLVAGGTGMYGAISPNANVDDVQRQVKVLNERVTKLEIEKKILNSLFIRLLSSQGILDEDVELEAFIIEMPSGKVTPTTK